MAIRRYAGDKITCLSSDIKPLDIMDGATAYETDTLIEYLKVNGVWHPITFGGSSASFFLEEDVVSMVTAGAIVPQDLMPYGMTFTEFVKDLLLTTFYPTFVNPTFSLTSNQASMIESGTVPTTFILTYNFSRGSIVGTMVGGIWVPATFQDYRTGPATDYTIDGLSMGLTNNRTQNNYPNPIVDGNNTYSGTVTYSIGPQPLDSDGANYLTPYPAGSQAASLTILGRRQYFYGVSNLATSSALIRTLTGALNPLTNTSFTINIPIGAENVVFSYPNTLRAVDSVIYVEGFNAEVKDIFVETTVSVEGANGYSPINYRVYIYTPVEPFPAIATYIVTI
jgi:hypothetical protein